MISCGSARSELSARAINYHVGGNPRGGPVYGIELLVKDKSVYRFRLTQSNYSPATAFGAHEE